ncbi:MAG: bifunctional phosphoribosyl-AMP cyclohydrolase/phosphoribosyl-ATP diphosphatase HisIE [Acidobacteriota bacterium]
MEIDFEKYADGLAPAIVQDADTHIVLMVGFMNAQALELSKTSGKVTFYSRSRETLWVKGETSGSFLFVENILTDCDTDTILIKARPAGPTCHTGSDTCFDEINTSANFLTTLEGIIRDRKTRPKSDSYTSQLFASGINRIAQKVGEEAIELVIEAKDSNDDKLKNEAADLIYHLLVLLAAKDISFASVIKTLERRQK